MNATAKRKLDELVRRLVKGEGIDHEEMSSVVIATGVSFAEVSRMCDRLAASERLVPAGRAKAERMVPGG